MCRRHGVMIISDFAYGEINFDGYKAPASCRGRAPRRSASSSPRCPRATTWPAGASASARQRRDGQGAGDDQGLLRLRPLRADPDRQRDRDARVQADAEEQSQLTRSGATSSAAASTSSAGRTKAHGQHVRLGEDQPAHYKPGRRARSTSACG
jgi:hypothetical protein